MWVALIAAVIGVIIVPRGQPRVVLVARDAEHGCIEPDNLQSAGALLPSFFFNEGSQPLPYDLPVDVKPCSINTVAACSFGDGWVMNGGGSVLGVLFGLLRLPLLFLVGVVGSGSSGARAGVFGGVVIEGYRA